MGNTPAADPVSVYIREKEALLSKKATRSAAATRRYNKKAGDIRAPFSRDADRIIHTRAYSRYIDKTQVFYQVENDHITHRVLHVQIVSKIARTIGRSLRLNEDLIEAIALGHDIGHAPYGHTGEDFLSGICKRKDIGRFGHNVQSVRFLQDIEDRDLTLQVLDGILCHDGEASDGVVRPVPYDDWETFDRISEDFVSGSTASVPAPMTPEGCIVRFADTISYIGRDLEDAQEIGLAGGFSDLPAGIKEVLGQDNARVIDTLIRDLIRTCLDTGLDGLSYSPEVRDALAAFKAFNRDRIYENPSLSDEKKKIGYMYGVVFDSLLDDVDRAVKSSPVFAQFLDATWINPDYRKRTTGPEWVRDFIAGMTDRYFNRTFREYTMPKRYNRKIGNQGTDRC